MLKQSELEIPEIHKMLIRIANREDPDQTASSEQSDLGLHRLSRSVWQATSVGKFRKFTVSEVLTYLRSSAVVLVLGDIPALVLTKGIIFLCFGGLIFPS